MLLAVVGTHGSAERTRALLAVVGTRGIAEKTHVSPAVVGTRGSADRTHVLLAVDIGTHGSADSTGISGVVAEKCPCVRRTYILLIVADGRGAVFYESNRMVLNRARMLQSRRDGLLAHPRYPAQFTTPLLLLAVSRRQLIAGG